MVVFSLPESVRKSFAESKHIINNLLFIDNKIFYIAK
jgi:hypothetical protein